MKKQWSASTIRTPWSGNNWIENYKTLEMIFCSCAIEKNLSDGIIIGRRTDFFDGRREKKKGCAWQDMTMGKCFDAIRGVAIESTLGFPRILSLNVTNWIQKRKFKWKLQIGCWWDFHLWDLTGSIKLKLDSNLVWLSNMCRNKLFRRIKNHFGFWKIAFISCKFQLNLLTTKFFNLI